VRVAVADGVGAGTPVQLRSCCAERFLLVL
jgi:hypothetical protein